MPHGNDAEHACTSTAATSSKGLHLPQPQGGVCSSSEPSMGSSMAALGLRQPSKWDIIVGLLLAKPLCKFMRTPPHPPTLPTSTRKKRRAGNHGVLWEPSSLLSKCLGGSLFGIHNFPNVSSGTNVPGHNRWEEWARLGLPGVAHHFSFRVHLDFCFGF